MMERLRNLPSPIRLLLGITLAAIGSGILTDLLDDQADALESTQDAINAADAAINERRATIEHLDDVIAVRQARLAQVPQVTLPDDGEQHEVPVQPLPQVTR